MHSPIYQAEGLAHQQSGCTVSWTVPMSQDHLPLLNNRLLPPLHSSGGRTLPSIRQVLGLQFEHLPKRGCRETTTGDAAEHLGASTAPFPSLIGRYPEQSIESKAPRKSLAIGPGDSHAPWDCKQSARWPAAGDTSITTTQHASTATEASNPQPSQEHLNHPICQQQPSALEVSYASSRRIVGVQSAVDWSRPVSGHGYEESPPSPAASIKDEDHACHIVDGGPWMTMDLPDNTYRKLVRRYREGKTLAEVVRLRFDHDDERPVLFGKEQKPRTTPIIKIGSPEYDRLTPIQQASERHKATERQRRLDHSKFWAELDNRIPDEMMRLAVDNIDRLTSERGSKEKNTKATAAGKGPPGKDILHNAAILQLEHDAMLFSELWREICRLKPLEQQLFDSRDLNLSLSEHLAQYESNAKDAKQPIKQRPKTKRRLQHSAALVNLYTIGAPPRADSEASTATFAEEKGMSTLQKAQTDRQPRVPDASYYGSPKHWGSSPCRSLKRSLESISLESRKRISPGRCPPSPAASTSSSWEDVKHSQGSSSTGSSLDD